MSRDGRDGQDGRAGRSVPQSAFASLDPCVHCGFCLPACPTYLATGDEADSPRGRIVLMRGLERGEIAPDDPALTQHIDACLGCRGCEPVCPSGVGYGRGLEAARELMVRHHGLRPLARMVLAIFGSKLLWNPIFAVTRLLRSSGLARTFAGDGRLGFSIGMVAATQPAFPAGATEKERPAASDRETVALFRGCVMNGLFSHIHDATRRTLEANGYRVIEVSGQTCCGALHEHAGDRRGAERLARSNLKAFADAADYVVINSAGCGALLKDYGHLLDSPEAVGFAEKVKDIAELLALTGPKPGAPVPIDTAYDAPCHLQHAQRVHEAPLAVLRAIPGLRLQLLPGFDRCCGSAGIYSMLEPEMSRAVLDSKIQSLAEASPRPEIVATGNPGCLMQIGAGLLAAGLPIRVAHPVELLDESYRRAGYYG